MIVGIDLGTTNSLVAYFTEDGPKIIPNRLGKNLTPSVVSVGHDAFFNCRSLRHVAWPASATEVPGTCFHACTSLKSITLPEGVTVI